MDDKVEVHITLDKAKYVELEESLKRFAVYTDWNVTHLLHVIIDLYLKEWQREKQIMDALQSGFDIDDLNKDKGSE